MTLGLLYLGCTIAVLVLGLRQLSRRGEARAKASKERVRRAGGHAMLMLQEFVEPRVEHVHYVAEERKDEEDHGAGDDPEHLEWQVRERLLANLRERPVDPHEVRRQLTAARRVGLDWRRLYAESVQDVLAEQPYLAPFLPPVGRVAPWEGDAGD